MHFEPSTPLGVALRLSLLFLWRQLRTALSLHPVTPQALWRIARGGVRMHTLVCNLDRLALRFLEGTLPKPRTHRARATSARATTPATPATPTPATPLPPRERDPTTNAWLTRVWQPAAQGAEALEYMFEHRPDLRALAEASPAAVRLLRPLARMFGARLPSWLQLPPRRPRKPRPPRPRAPRPLPLTHPDLKLQPWVISWVRASRKKYGRD